MSPNKRRSPNAQLAKIRAELGPVAEYVRKSTDYQRYSVEYQSEAIRKYAVQHHMTVVRSYVDDGRSGLTLQGRPGLKKLLNDVISGDVDFSAILVYDISRWGRFQDIDESAYYEFMCKRAGVRVIYCAELFDDTPMGVLMKNMKRVMAGEHSRSLSVRVWGGQAQVAALGYKLGGQAGFGLRRLLIDQQGKPKCILGPGVRKALQSDRVILIPGPSEEVEVVWKIYDWYAFDRKREDEIVALLKASSLPGWPAWTRKIVHGILTAPKYAGDNVFNRHSQKLKTPQRRNPKEEWIRHERAFRGLVTRELFDRVQELVAAGNRRRYGMRWMKRRLWDLLQKKGELSAALIRAEPGMPAPNCYSHRFGGLRAAYEAVGYCRLNHRTFLENSQDLSARRSRLARELVTRFADIGIPAVWSPYRRLLEVDGSWSLSINILRSHWSQGRRLLWHSEFKGHTIGDLLLIIRMGRGNSHFLDYYVLPRSKLKILPMTLTFRAPRLLPFKITAPDVAMLVEAQKRWPEVRQRCRPWDIPANRS